MRRGVFFLIAFSVLVVSGSGLRPALAQRGGWDPKSIMERIDKNKNGVIEKGEVDGRGEGWIKRYIPDANFEKGVSVASILKAMDRSREERERDDRRSRERDDRDREEETRSLPDTLVLGFGEDIDLPPVINFGSTPENYVEVSQSNLDKARNTMSKYDRNKDGILDRAERDANHRWLDDPMQYDINRDDRISLSELALRYAHHDKSAREREEGKSSDRRRRRDDDEDEVPAVEVVYGTRRETPYVTNEESLPEGLPDWFIEKDANKDGQLSMAEYLGDITPDAVAEFTKMDRDDNGVVNPAEMGVQPEPQDAEKIASDTREDSGRSVASNRYRSGDSGNRGDRSGGGSRDGGYRERSRSSSSTASTSRKGSTESKTSASPAASADIDEKYLKYAKGRVEQYDANRDGVLSVDECKAGKPGLVEADADKDGKITVNEVASYYQRLYKR